MGDDDHVPIPVPEDDLPDEGQGTGEHADARFAALGGKGEGVLLPGGILCAELGLQWPNMSPRLSERDRLAGPYHEMCRTFAAARVACRSGPVS